MKIVKKILIALLIVLIGMQFYRPKKNVSESNVVALFETETQPSGEVAAILESKCYDCHSNHTNYPWYAEVSPVSLWIRNHVEEGKEHFNVSDWNEYSIKKKDHKLDELIEEVEENYMPISSYTRMHGNLTDTEKELLINWAKEVRSTYKSKE